MYEINETGKFLWEAIDKNKTIDSLVTTLQNAIVDDVPRNVIQNDVSEYIMDLIDKHFLLEVAIDG